MSKNLLTQRYSPSATRWKCFYRLEYRFRLRALMPIWSCCLVKVLVTRAKFLQPSGYCTEINFAFTFYTFVFFLFCFGFLFVYFFVLFLFCFVLFFAYTGLSVSSNRKVPELDNINRSSAQLSNITQSEVMHNVYQLP